MAGQPPFALVRAVGVDQVEATARWGLGAEREPAPIGRPRRGEATTGARGQATEARAVLIDDVDVAWRAASGKREAARRSCGGLERIAAAARRRGSHACAHQE